MAYSTKRDVKNEKSALFSITPKQQHFGNLLAKFPPVSPPALVMRRHVLISELHVYSATYFRKHL